MRSEFPHRGITMHELPVGGNLPGLLFVVGGCLIFLFAIPALWYVLAGAAALGLIVAAALMWRVPKEPLSLDVSAASVQRRRKITFHMEY